MKKYILILVILMLNSCGPGYVNYYKNNYDSYILSPPKTIVPEHVEVKDYPEYDTILKNGYVLIGQSNYLHSMDNEYNFDASTFGGEIGADKVIIKKPTYHHSATATYTSYNVSSYNISGNSSGYGSLGGDHYRYTSQSNLDITVRTPTTEQYTYGVYLYSALYLKKINYIFGCYFKELGTDDMNIVKNGIKVKFVVKNSPADTNDFYVNDIIISVNGDKIYNIEQMNKIETKNHDSLVTVNLIRNTDTLTKTFKFN